MVDFFENGVDHLKHKQKKVVRKERGEREPAKCRRCGAILVKEEPECPECGLKRIVRKRKKITVAPGHMSELDYATAKGSRDWAKDKSWTWRQMCGWAIQWTKGNPETGMKLAARNYIELYGEWPRPYEFMPIDNPDQRVLRKMKQQREEWKKSQKQKAKASK